MDGRSGTRAAVAGWTLGLALLLAGAPGQARCYSDSECPGGKCRDGKCTTGG